MKKVLIYGYGTSGKSVEQVLEKEKISYKIYDDNIKIKGGIFLKRLDMMTVLEFDTIVISPAISIYNKYLQFAMKNGVKVISEIEFGSMYVKNIIAVTGTNGKTSTVTLIHSILSNAGYKTALVGNIGVPLSTCYGQMYDYVVTEVSSFQLEAIDTFSPIISVLLNIAPDHIDRHKGFKNYVQAKLNIFKNISSDNYAITNAIDTYSNIKGSNVLTFSDERKNADTRYDGQKIYFKGKEVFSIDDEDLPTYIDNILASVTVCKTLGVDDRVIEDTVRNFQKDKHRLQKVATINNVDYIDDSKATNIHAVEGAIKSLKKYENITLLIGGNNKGLSFRDFLRTLDKRVNNLVCFGKCRYHIYLIAKFYGLKNVHIAKRLQNAVTFAMDSTTSGVVLLSPACSSFDEFSSYAERGDKFQEYVIGYGKA